MLDVLVRKPLTVGALGQSDPFPQRPVIGFAVDGV